MFVFIIQQTKINTMKDYLLLIRGGDDRMEGLSEEQKGEHMQRWGAFMSNLVESGNLAGGLPLTADGRLMTSAGTTEEVPLTSSGEAIGGYLMLKANDYDHAVELSKDCPVFEHDGNLEIREAVPMDNI
jgi:hypothetical protein